MSLFSFNKKKDFYAPVSGKLIDLKDVRADIEVPNLPVDVNSWGR